MIGNSSWGGSGKGGHSIGKVGRVVFHHYYRPDVAANASQAVEEAATRSVDKYHRQQGWSGIGYNFVIYQSGRTFEGRGFGRSGAHTVGQNSKSIGICFGIDGDKHALTAKAQQAARDIVKTAQNMGYLTRTYEVYGHRNFANKSCPGNKVYPNLKSMLSHGPVTPSEPGEVVLGPRDKGGNVRAWQRQLIQLGYNIEADAVFGSNTEKATRQFQKSAGITVDGMVGPETRAAMKAALSKQPKGGDMNAEAEKFYEDMYEQLKKLDARPTSLPNILKWYRDLRALTK